MKHSILYILIVLFLLSCNSKNSIKLSICNRSNIVNPITLNIFIEDTFFLTDTFYNNELSENSNIYQYNTSNDKLKIRIETVDEGSLVDTVLLLSSNNSILYITFDYRKHKKTDEYLQYEKEVFNLKYPNQTFMPDSIEITAVKGLSLYLTDEK